MSIIEEKLREYDFFDGSIIRHGNLDYVRDYEIIAYIPGATIAYEVRYLFKGCLKVNYAITVKPEHFSMDSRLLNLSREDEPDYPKAFIWAAGADAYPGWKLEENTEELKLLGNEYGLKLYKILIETNAYNLNIIFNDLAINILKEIKKKKANNFIQRTVKLRFPTADADVIGNKNNKEEK